MNIEEAIKVLNNFNPVDCGREDTQAIETLLTAYEKEKEKNKELQELYTGALQDWCKEKEKNKEYEILLKRREELEQEKENLIKQGWLNE